MQFSDAYMYMCHSSSMGHCDSVGNVTLVVNPNTRSLISDMTRGHFEEELYHPYEYRTPCAVQFLYPRQHGPLHLGIVCNDIVWCHWCDTTLVLFFFPKDCSSFLNRKAKGIRFISATGSEWRNNLLIIQY